MEVFEGRIIVVSTEKEAEKAIAYLSSFSNIGFDSETRPAFHKGKSYQVALLQLATDDTCFLFRLNKMGFPDCLINLLANPAIKKIGLSLKDDFSAIRKREKEFKPEGFIELQSYVTKFGIAEAGLQRIYAILYGKKISKSQRLSNWEQDELSDAQKMYAAIDAWACLKIYEKLSALID
nr:3'-5' exonuclease [Dysgonomonas sp. 520]